MDKITVKILNDIFTLMNNHEECFRLLDIFSNNATQRKMINEFVKYPVLRIKVNECQVKVSNDMIDWDKYEKDSDIYWSFPLESIENAIQVMEQYKIKQFLKHEIR